MKHRIRIRTIIMILVVFTSLLSSTILVAAEFCSAGDMVGHINTVSNGYYFGSTQCLNMAEKYDLDANNSGYKKCLDDVENKVQNFYGKGGNARALAGIAYTSGKSCGQIASEYLHSEKEAEEEGHKNGEGIDKILDDYPDSAKNGIEDCKGIGLCNQWNSDELNNNQEKKDALTDLTTQNEATHDKGKSFIDNVNKCAGSNPSSTKLTECKKAAIDDLWKNQKVTKSDSQSGYTKSLPCAKGNDLSNCDLNSEEFNSGGVDSSKDIILFNKMNKETNEITGTVELIPLVKGGEKEVWKDAEGNILKSLETIPVIKIDSDGNQIESGVMNVIVKDANGNIIGAHTEHPKSHDAPANKGIMAENSVIIALVSDDSYALNHLLGKIEGSNELEEDKEEIYGNTLKNSLPPPDPTSELPEDWEEDGEFSDMDEWAKTEVEQELGELPAGEPEPDPPCWVTKSCIHPKNPLRPYSCQDNCAKISSEKPEF